MATTAPRLLILGLDGATWTVLDPMRRLGLMPNLDALLNRSAHGTLRSVVPPVTTAAWTSCAAVAIARSSSCTTAGASSRSITVAHTWAFRSSAAASRTAF